MDLKKLKNRFKSEPSPIKKGHVIYALDEKRYYRFDGMDFRKIKESEVDLRKLYASVSTS